jgi:hypothetical protein
MTTPAFPDDPHGMLHAVFHPGQDHSHNDCPLYLENGTHFRDGDVVAALPTVPLSSGPFLHVMIPDPED